MIRKLICLSCFLLVIILVFPLSAKPKFVTTIHPLKAILERITGERVTVICRLDPDGCDICKKNLELFSSELDSCFKIAE